LYVILHRKTKPILGGAGKENMKNAKDEFVEFTCGYELLCAVITFGPDYDEENQTHHVLRCGFSESEREAFLNSLDFLYNNGLGGQNLFGNIWYKDGTWCDRGEYDGSEWWQHQKSPEIPKECAAGH
jgi:hypothetical protein